MGDRRNDSDENSSTRSSNHEWELIPSSPRSPSLPEFHPDSLPENNLQEPGSVGLIGDTNGLVQMNYFGSPSASLGDDSPSQEFLTGLGPSLVVGVVGVESVPASGASHGDVCLASTHLEFEDVPDSYAGALPLSVSPDWIEPTSPYHSCAMVTEEEGDDHFEIMNFHACVDDTESPSPGGRQTDVVFELCRAGPSSTYGTAGLPSATWLSWNQRPEDLFRDDQGRKDVDHAYNKDDSLDSLSGIDDGFVPMGTPLAFGETFETDASGNSLGVGEMPVAAFSPNDGCKDHSCEVWWKRQLTLWQSQARQANTLCSIALAAAVMGLVIVGHGWQRLRLQNQMLRFQLCSKEKKISQLMYQLIRMKESLSNSRRVPVIRAQHMPHGFLEYL